MRQLILCCMLLYGSAAASSDGALAVDWNALVLEIAEDEDGLLTLKGVRATAMLHLAMARAIAHEGSGDEQRRYQAAAAAHAVALHEYPDRAGALDALLARSQPPIAQAEREAWRQRGTLAASTVLQARAGDGWDSPGSYRWRSPSPGVYAPFAEHSGTPPDFVFGAGWAQARPFALVTPQEFRVAPPPAIDSLAYAQAYEEVRRVGAAHARYRSDDQTHLALWWKDFVERSHNRLAREWIEREALALTDAVHFLAWLNASIFDAYVASFDSKYHHNHWRPYSAIRWPDDGNPATTPEPGWTNTHDHTYAFPSYPSAHGTACGAAMTVFAHVFGDDRAVRMRTEQVDRAGPGSGKMAMVPASRAFPSFSAAADECGRSRVYLGIHFAYDSTVGVALGRQVGRAVIERLALTP